MTRKFGQKVHCPKCGHEHTVECGFSRWIREQGQDIGGPLNSAEGTVCGDTDFVVHRYCIRRGTIRDRAVQYIMLVEVKSRGAELRDEQRDTLLFLDAIFRTKQWNLRNREAGRITASEPAWRVYSVIAKRKVQVICYGVHTLRMSGDSPATSRRMWWDNKPIDESQLIDVLSFNTNPDSLNRLEHRNHKKQRRQVTLFPI